MAARKTKLNKYQSRKKFRNEVIAIIYETCRDTSVTRPPQPRRHDQLSAIQWAVA